MLGISQSVFLAYYCVYCVVYAQEVTCLISYRKQADLYSDSIQKLEDRTIDVLLVFHQIERGQIRTQTSKAGIPNDHGGNVKVAMTVCTVAIPVSGVCAEACHWCIKQWVTVAAVGILASVASIRFLPVWRTRRYYIYTCNGRSRAGEGRCSQTLFFRYEMRGATAAVSISCVLGVTSTDVVGLFSS